MFPRLFQTSVTAVVSLVTLPRTVTFRRMVSVYPFLSRRPEPGEGSELEVAPGCGARPAGTCEVLQPGSALCLPLKPAITAAEAATSPRTARSPSGSGSSAATTAASPATWPATATTPTSRSATPAASSGTSRKTAPKSSATGEPPPPGRAPATPGVCGREGRQAVIMWHLQRLCRKRQGVCFVCVVHTQMFCHEIRSLCL